jgi:hypothetical protein
MARRRPQRVPVALGTGSGYASPCPLEALSGDSGPKPTPGTPQAQTVILDDFPLPEIARTLSPNGRAHWRTKSRAADVVRKNVWVAVMTQGIRPVPPPVHVTWRWIVPDRRRRDQDNHGTGVVKVAQDRLVSLGILAADHSDALTGHVEIVYERGARRLEIVLKAGRKHE